MLLEESRKLEDGESLVEGSPERPNTYGTAVGDRDVSLMCDHSEPCDRPAISEATGGEGPADKLSQLLRGKDKEWAATVEKQRPLRLLDLPVDVLKEIIKEVTHTNDLTSLALTHSALHNLAIPYIYSRFDIVWPETQVTSDPRTGVDALTYGLSTLVMSEDIFADSASKYPCYFCSHCGKQSKIPKNDLPEDRHAYSGRRRKGNDFARYVRKFSLGNGPPDWVQEYLISKESGKMLGTLVALAIARMPNLETFVWDMPTGVLRDVWSALASLGDRRDGERARLERIWIRWHDNKNVITPTSSQPAGASPHPLPLGVPSHSSTLSTSTPSVDVASSQTILSRSYRNVEHPNFSVLPPLRSVTVLDIDEPAYLDELSVLVERSSSCLRELRIGLAPVFLAMGWSGTMQSSTAVPIPPDSSMAHAASGGVLGMIMSKLYDCRIQTTSLSSIVREAEVPAKQVEAELVAENAPPTLLGSSQPELHIEDQPNLTTTDLANAQAKQVSESDVSLPIVVPLPSTTPPVPPNASDQRLAAPAQGSPLPDVDDINTESSPNLNPELPVTTLPLRPAKTSIISANAPQPSPSKKQASNPAIPSETSTTTAKPVTKQRKLKLEILELEKVPIYVSVLLKTIDWTVLTSLTLLNCDSDEELWKALRRTYAPKSNPISTPFSNHSTLRCTSSHPRKSSSTSPTDYPLRLKKVHTNHVSPALVAFLKEALAPNSLEWMFLQDGGAPASKVTIDSIYRGPLRRHRASLKKVLIDSGDKRQEGSSRNQKWKKWMFTREVLTFITSGKMTCLRELAMAIDYKDWHFFLQRLPQIPHLRSLYVPHIADHVHGHHFDARELALQVVDIVTLRPEVEICYMGISTKCFEILENKSADDQTTSYHDSATTSANTGPGGVGVGDPDDDSDVDDDDHDEDDDDDGVQAATAITGGHPTNDSDTADDSEGNSDDEGLGSEDGKKLRLKLREILFYDDKVSIFKARHGQL